MKHLVIALAVLATFSASAQIGVDAIAKQRARDVANQNNNRSVDLPNQTARPTQAAPAVSATPTPGQQAFATFQSQLFQVSSNSTPDVKQKLADDMANVAQGANKPSQATLSKLSEQLIAALNESTKLTTTRKTRVAQEVGVLLNSANTLPAQKLAMIDDIKSTLQSGGASSDTVTALGDALQSVTDEIKTAAK